MSKVYIISDLHLGHESMAIKRGFKSSADHDEYLITNYNSVVSKRDVCWILGDISMEKTSSYHLLDRLNGLKKVVLGNHDLPQHVPILLKYVRSVSGLVKYKGCWLSHCPVHPSEFDRARKNYHGHVHEKSIEDEMDRYINVCCEVLDFKPMLFETEYKKVVTDNIDNDPDKPWNLRK